MNEIKPPDMDCEDLSKKFLLKDSKGDMVQYGIKITKNMFLAKAGVTDFFCGYIYISEKVAKALDIWQEFKPLAKRLHSRDCYILTDKQQDKQHSFFPPRTGGMTYNRIHQTDECKTLVLGYDQNHSWNESSNFYGSWTNEFALLGELMENIHRAYCQSQETLPTFLIETHE